MFSLFDFIFWRKLGVRLVVSGLDVKRSNRVSPPNQFSRSSFWRLDSKDGHQWPSGRDYVSNDDRFDHYLTLLSFFITTTFYREKNSIGSFSLTNFIPRLSLLLTGLFRSDGQRIAGSGCDYQFISQSGNSGGNSGSSSAAGGGRLRQSAQQQQQWRRGKFYSPLYPSLYPPRSRCFYHFYGRYVPIFLIFRLSFPLLFCSISSETLILLITGVCVCVCVCLRQDRPSWDDRWQTLGCCSLTGFASRQTRKPHLIRERVGQRRPTLFNNVRSFQIQHLTRTKESVPIEKNENKWILV